MALPGKDKRWKPCTVLWICACLRDTDISNSYTIGYSHVRGDNPRALAKWLSYVQVDKHGIIILYHLHQCRRLVHHEIFRSKIGKGVIKKVTP